jgi:hypothetical protein
VASKPCVYGALGCWILNRNSLMAVEEYLIDFAKLGIHECGAALITLLAYPANSEKERSQLHASLCANALRTQFLGPPDDQVAQLMKPIYAFRDREEIIKDLKTLKRRLRDRMVAARMAMGFLQLAAGKVPKLPAGIRRLSLNQMSEMVLVDAGQSEPENVETRIWRPSLPVIHLAAATAVKINNVEKAGLGRFDFMELIMCRPLVEAIVHEAQAYEGLMSKSPHFPLNPANFVRLRLAGE